MLELILPLAFQSPAVLHSLLALSRSCGARSEAQLNQHHAALKELVADITAARSCKIDMGHVNRALASSLLLSIFAIGNCDKTWSHHIRGMASLVRSADRAVLASHTTGWFLLSMCAFSDISALSVGQDRLSQKGWLSWMTPRPENPLGSSFTTLEVTVGYPESLIDIIAQVAELADDGAYFQASGSLYAASTPATSVASLPAFASPVWPSQELEGALKRWTPMELPGSMSSFQQIALRTAWNAIRKACLLFLWRGCGFHSNLTELMPGNRAAESQALVGHILSDLSVTLDLCRTQKLSIATAMMWPLAVVGCECGHSTEDRQAKTLSLLKALRDIFAMHQAQHLAKALECLWQRLLQSSLSFVSLELVCRDMNLVIPLL